ncbi:unnamed protein product, partial [Darwinula stevensoni]
AGFREEPLTIRVSIKITIIEQNKEEAFTISISQLPFGMTFHFQSGSGGEKPRSRKEKYSGSHSRSRSFSPYSKKRETFRSSRSRSPMSNRKRHQGSRDAPVPGRVLGVFGLSLFTTERELYHIFNKFGPIEKVQVVLDAQSGRSRGFAFVYYESLDDAKAAKEECSGMEIDGRKIRVDFSITKRAHTPTPGIYMGRPSNRGFRGRQGGRGRSPSPYYRGRRYERYERSRSRSFSPPPR